MDRRGFLGRVLGTIIVTQVPWVEDHIHPLFDDVIDTPIIEKKDLLLRLQSGIRLVDGTLLKGPGIKSVERHEDGRLQFSFMDVEARTELRTIGAVILTERGSIYREANFSGPQYLFDGDTLKVTLTTPAEAPFGYGHDIRKYQ